MPCVRGSRIGGSTIMLSSRGNHACEGQKGAARVSVEPSNRTLCSTWKMRENGGLAQPFSWAQLWRMESTQMAPGCGSREAKRRSCLSWWLAKRSTE